MATLATRPPKRLEDREKQLSAWREAAESLGFGWSQAKTLLNRAPLTPISDDHRLAAASLSVDQILRTISHFPERGLIRRLADDVCTSGWSAKQVREAVRDTLCSPRMLKVAVEKDQPQYTTREVIGEEKSILKAAERLSKSRRHVVRSEIVEQVIAAQEKKASKRPSQLLDLVGFANSKNEQHPLSDELRTALRAVTEKLGDICVVSGPPGTSKTGLVREIANCCRAEGYHLVGMAFTGKAAQGLEEATGIKSTTIHKAIADLTATKFDDLTHHARQLTRAARGKPTWGLDRVKLDERSIVVIDEASMASSEQLGIILKHVEKAGAKCILVGDSDQVQSIERGGALAAIARRFGEVRLTTIVRQNEEWAREAVLAVARGESKSALKAYADRGLLHVATDRKAAIEALVNEWKQKAAGQPKSYIVVAPTNADVDQLNAKIQRRYRELGGLGMLFLKVNGECFHRGDRIVFEQNSTWRGVRNGTLGTVVKVNVLDRCLDVRLDSKEVVRVPLKRYPHVRLAYAVTVSKAQGVTCDNVLALVGSGNSLQDRELSLVMVSRARGITKLFCDRFEAGKDMQGLAQQMNQSHKKLFAHDVGRIVETDLRQPPRFSS